MPNVYVINKGGHDYTRAKSYGEVTFLSEGLIDKWDVKGIQENMQAALEYSQPTDYIVMTGLPIQNIIAASIFALKHKRLNLLIYRGSRYVCKTIKLENNNGDT